MTYEEAKDHLICGRINCLTDMDKDEELRYVCLKALEKQMPKKPYMDNENGVYEKEHCPTCHRSLFPYDHHCQCGQAIDWSDT